MKIRVEIKRRSPIFVEVKEKGKLKKTMKDIANHGISVKTNDGYDYYPSHRIDIVCYDGE